jgi:hypothetical protein
MKFDAPLRAAPDTFFTVAFHPGTRFVSRIIVSLLSFIGGATLALGAEPAVLLEETFEQPLSADWHWGLGTWIARDGVLRAFESGERRHGPVKQRHFAFTEADVRFEFRLEGKASFASFPIDGNRERSHIINFVMGRDVFRIIAHPKKGENVDLVREKITLADGDWHSVHIVLMGETLTVDFNGRTWTAKHPVVAEPKANVGFGGESGGPEGEKAGALEFRRLKITATPDTASTATRP